MAHSVCAVESVSADTGVQITEGIEVKTLMGIVGYVVIVIIIFGLCGWWEVYRFGDCKKVGHSTFYCIMAIGK